MNTANGPSEQAIVEESDVSDRFVHYVELPTLRDMASTQVALSIWYSYISSHPKLNEDPYYGDILGPALGIDRNYWSKCDEMVKSLQTPASIEKMLISVVKSVREEIELWIKGCQDNSYRKLWKAFHIKHFDVNWCVWLPNGRIDLPKTGLKMLSSGKLTLNQRFGIMSEFCMEEELKKIPWRSLDTSFVDSFSLNLETYLMYYWIRYLKNELHKIPLQNFNSLDAMMAERCEKRHCTAFQYFFNRLPDKEKVSMAMLKFSSNLSSTAYQDHCFSSLSWPQQKLLLSKIPDNMMINFWIFMHSPEAAMWVWKHSKHLMTPKQFAAVIEFVFPRRVEFEDESRLVLEMWHSASDQQRSQVVHTKEDYLIKSIIQNISHSKAVFEFLCEFLSLKSEDFRRQTLLGNALGLGFRIEDLDSMKKIIQLCLPNPADQLEYKTLILGSHRMEYRITKAFEKADFDNDLLLKLKFYSTDGKTTQEFLERSLKSEHAKHKYMSKVSTWNKFSQFVDEIFPQDPTSALNSKKQFITSYAKDCWNHWDDDTLNETDQILKMVFTNSDELQVVKKYFLDSFQKTLLRYRYWERFEEKYFKKFVSWCFNGDEKALAEFIRNIPVDDIFDLSINDPPFYCYDEDDDDYWVDDSFDESMLECLDRCFTWYFKGVEGARRYKLEKVHAFAQKGTFHTIFWQNHHRCLNFVLTWFFDGDKKAALKFKAEKKIKFSR